jgi:hypothetical protein
MSLPPEFAALQGLHCYPSLSAAYASPSAEAVLAVARALQRDFPAGALTAPVASPSGAGTPSPLALPPGGPFATVADVPCLVPRGRCEVDFYEGAVVVRPASAKEPPFLLGAAVNGVFALGTRGKSGPAGATHALVITLATPLMMGKTPHRALGFCDTGAALAKAGPARAALLRAPDAGKLKMPLGGGGGGGGGGSSAGGEGAGAELAALDTLALLKRLLGAVFGTVGEPDRGLFASATGEAGIRGYHKVRRDWSPSPPPTPTHTPTSLPRAAP